MLCNVLVPTVWFQGRGFTVPAVPCIPVDPDPKDVKGRDGFKQTHRASGAPNYGSGAYYSMQSPGQLSKEKSLFISSFSGTGATPCNPSSWGVTLSGSDRMVFAAPYGSSAYKRGAKYQSGWHIRDGYVICVTCYNFDWYAWKYSVVVAKLPTTYSVSGTTQLRVGITFTGRCCSCRWGEANPETQETFFQILDSMDPEILYSSSILNTSWKGCVSLVGRAVWESARYLGASDLSLAVYHDFVPSQYVKAASTAYYNALEHVPSLSFNPLTAVSDVKQMASLKLSLLSQRCPKGAASDYLQYRYGISPTLNDLEDLDRTISRALTIVGQEFVCNGYATAKDGTTVHATLRYGASTAYDMLVLSSPLKRLEQRLLVDSWDLIPFSFIVDWFVDVEKYLTDVSNLLVNETWKPSEIWISFHRSAPGIIYEYARVHGTSSLASTSLGLSDYVAQPNGRGIFYHISDGLAIVTQMFG